MLGIFAPEVVLWRAITQWRVARQVRDKRNELLDEVIKLGSKDASSPDPKTANAPRDSHHWELEHGFLVVMGGMGITSAEQNPEILDHGSTLTPYGALTFAKAGVLPEVDKERIVGRSKADSLGKTLVCLQALWMVVQTVSRKVAGLPITLLELNTLAHVACAVIMYFIWWKKPQNVSEVFEIPVQEELGFFLRPDDGKPWKPEAFWRERSLDDPKYHLATLLHIMAVWKSSVP